MPGYKRPQLKFHDQHNEAKINSELQKNYGGRENLKHCMINKLCFEEHRKRWFKFCSVKVKDKNLKNFCDILMTY